MQYYAAVRLVVHDSYTLAGPFTALRSALQVVVSGESEVCLVEGVCMCKLV